YLFRIRPPPRSPLFPYTTLFRSFNGVKAAENSIQQIFILRALFKIDKLFREQLKDLAGFDQKILEDLFISIETHPLAPSKTKTRSEEHTSELQSRENLVCRLLLE